MDGRAVVTHCPDACKSIFLHIISKKGLLAASTSDSMEVESEKEAYTMEGNRGPGLYIIFSFFRILFLIIAAPFYIIAAAAGLKLK